MSDRDSGLLDPANIRSRLLAAAAGSTPVAVFDANGSGVAQVLEALVESMPLSVWVLDHRGDVVRENVFAREVGLGAVRSARETSPGAPSLVGQVLLEGRESRGTARFRDATGDLTDVPIRGIPLRNANGSTVGALLMAPPPLTLPAGPPSVDFVFSDALRLSSASWDPIPGDVLSATWN